MKKYLLTTTLLLSGIPFINATILTVSNSPSTLAQYSTIQAAVDAATAGDTLYVHGSPNTYPAFTVANKQLVIIGPGWSPDKNLPFAALVSGCTLTGTSTSNTEVQGLFFSSTILVNANHPDNLRFIRNRFSMMYIYVSQSNTTYQGYLFEGNVFDNAQLQGTTNSTYQNFLFQNNYFYESGCCLGANISGFSNSVNVLFNHNLWFGPASGTRDCFAGNCRFLNLTNNIFVRRNVANQNSSGTFSNNITFNAGNNAPWDANGNVDGGSNIANQDPQMTDQTAVNAGSNNPLLDFTIAAGPANNSGTDGKDMGLLYDATGSLNWTNTRTSRLPYLVSMNIVNPTIPQGGTLNVQVQARKNN